MYKIVLSLNFRNMLELKQKLYYVLSWFYGVSDDITCLWTKWMMVYL
jgi:hypothetical protein